MRISDWSSDVCSSDLANEARGLDFRPPGGESPRDVQDRLRPLLAELADAGEDVVAVSHKGVLRALYALASGWDMRGKPAPQMADACPQASPLDARAVRRVERPKLPLPAAPTRPRAHQ